MEPIDNDSLMHYGTPRHSGRYPYGSGDNPYQHSGDFLARVEELKKAGLNDTAIAKAIGLTTTQFRTQRSLANAERRGLEVDRAKSLAADGLGPTEIGRIMGKSESTVRSLLNSDSEFRMRQARKTADFLKEQVDSKGMIDVGSGVERELGVSREKMKQALETLKLVEEKYKSNELNYIALQDARKDYIHSVQEYIESLYNYNLALIQVEMAMHYHIVDIHHKTEHAMCYHSEEIINHLNEVLNCDEKEVKPNKKSKRKPDAL